MNAPNQSYVMNELEAENKRLREALRIIMAKSTRLSVAYKIATQALKGEK